MKLKAKMIMHSLDFSRMTWNDLLGFIFSCFSKMRFRKFTSRCKVDKISERFIIEFCLLMLDFRVDKIC